MKYLRVLILLAIVAAVAGWAACYFGWLPNPLAAPVVAPGETKIAEAEEGIDKDGNLRVMGWLEPANGIVNIHGPTGDRLEKLAVSEDRVVEPGQTLAVLASRHVKELQKNMLDCQVREATLRKDAESRMADVRICTAELGIEKLKLKDVEAQCLEQKKLLLQDNLNLATKDYERLQKLQGTSKPIDQPDSLVSYEPLVSAQELERQELLVHRANTEFAAAAAELRMLQASKDPSQKAAEAEYKAAVAGKGLATSAIPLESLANQCKIAQAELDLTEIKAPRKGIVLKIFVQEGEALGPKPILRMADVDQMDAVVEVLNISVKRLRIGQKAVIKSDAFHKPFESGLKGKVTAIGRVVNTPELKNLDPYARVDRHVIPVRISLEKDHCVEAARFVNMQVDVEIQTGADAAGR